MPSKTNPTAAASVGDNDDGTDIGLSFEQGIKLLQASLRV
jgi:hypothetical protein